MRQVLFSRRKNPMQARAKHWHKEAWWQDRRIDPLAKPLGCHGEAGATHQKAILCRPVIVTGSAVHDVRRCDENPDLL